MVFWDNESRLVQHLCHSFVISDDTGYSDRIFIDDEDSIEETDQGYHINQRLLTGVGILWVKHTHSITKKELDQKVRDIENASKCKPHTRENIVKLVDETPSVFETAFQFTKKELCRKNCPPSLLTEQISQLYLEEFPFFQFSKFSAFPSDEIRSLSVTIIFDESKTFLNVTAVYSIRIFELIGLSLYLYHRKRLGLPLSDPVDNFMIYIADENGEIDRDFPALDRSDYLKKFRFSHLGLVRVESTNKLIEQQDPIQCVVISYKLGDYPVEEKTITISRAAVEIQMIEVLSLAIRKKGLIPCESYILSEFHDSLNPIAHNRFLSEFSHYSFWFLKQGKSDDHELIPNTSGQENYYDSTIPHGFEHFEAYWLNKKGEPLTQISISEVQITFKPLIIDSKQTQRSKLRLHLTLPKTEFLSRSSVVRCGVLARPPSVIGRKGFYITAIKGSEKKNYEFEAENSIVTKIIQSLSNTSMNISKYSVQK
eukprot:TRINITY_DN3618_c0_g1_i1.p1 TRINITY_DN3618_c0_g1~~TRINITY_DN3618_c0_g1_i1.p1  ORF type:complete len:483 (-),score=-0.07 TRINITY_DN3618_c0_g1_i1:56-1504(-)